VAESEPIPTTSQATPNNLVLRVVSALVMAPLALGAAYLGGLVFLAFWAIAALIVLWEWDAVACGRDKAVLSLGVAAMVGASLLWTIGHVAAALLLPALGALAAAAHAAQARRLWCAAGVLYASALLLAPLLLRADAAWGFQAIVFLFAVVWLTDIMAYFVGRAVGGPKLLPRISPNKTWAGAIGGVVGGVAGGLAVARFVGIGNLAAIGALALVLSIIGQAGDLLESAIKRHFAVKDAGRLIPGHGGLMDRLDTFFAVVVVAAALGLARGGLAAPGRGLLVW